MGAKAVIIMDTEKRDSMLWLTPSSMETSRRVWFCVFCHVDFHFVNLRCI